jgi:hypothetical protein
MNEAEFNAHLEELRRIEFREDYERALYDLCMSCKIEQCLALRGVVSDRKLWHSKPWRNAADFDRSDLSREDRLKRCIAAWVVMDGVSGDFRDDLCALAWQYHTLLVNGRDADALFRDVARRCDPRIAKLIVQFIDRNPANKSLEAFRLCVEQTPDGPRVYRKG